MLPIISVSSTTTQEASSLITFNVVLSEASLDDVTVQYRAVQDGSAQLGVFGDVDTGIAEDTFLLTIPAGETQGQITYSINNNDADEFDENFTVEFSDPTNATLAGGEPVLTATGVILDSAAGPNLALFVSDPLVFETDAGGQQAVFEVRLSQPSTQAVTLNYTTADGTALAGEDFVSTAGSLTFAPGQTVASVAVDIIGDNINEALETFSLVVTPTLAIANGVADAAGVAEILNDDGSDTVPELSVSSAEVTEGTDTIVFRVSLSEPSLSDVTVQYRAVQDGTAQVAVNGDVDDITPSDVFTLTIPAGSTQAEVALSIEGFDTDEVDENFTIEFSNPVNAILSGGEPVLTATGVILDSDGGQNLALFVSDPLVFETQAGGQQAVFEVRLSQPSAQAVTISYATANGTALAGQDFVAASGTLTFAPGQTVASVAVDILSSDVAEVTETFSLVLTNVPAFINADDSIGIGSIQDNAQLNGTAGNDNLSGSLVGDVVNGLGGDDTLSGLAGNDNISGGDGDDAIAGGAGNDTVDGGEGADNINGGIGADLLNGGGGNDVIFGLNGFDVLNGNDGDDSLNGGFGNDTLNGGGGNDTLNGGLGFDSLSGGTEDDVLLGLNGQDTLNGDDGNDSLNGGNGNDLLDGGAGIDTLEGGLGADVLNGGDGDDLLRGLSGFDRLDGGAGNDDLEGNAGNDVLDGGLGNDFLRGGQGADVFVFRSGQDVIVDYSLIVDSFQVEADLLDEADPVGSDLANYAEIIDGDVVFDFGDGNTLTFNNVTNLNLLFDDVTFI